jgi:hypothetical protein
MCVLTTHLRTHLPPAPQTDPDDEMDEDDRAFFAARGLLKDKSSSATGAPAASDIDRMLIVKSEAVHRFSKVNLKWLYRLNLLGN